MTDDLPLVSCIMPTKDRRAFAARAIEYFLRQDYPDRELIIVDDGHDRIPDLARVDERIRYVPLEHRLSLGAKRNLACEHARGSLIAHWDDDDWSAPRRLSYQVKGLRESGADICGTDRLLFYDSREGRALEYVYRAGGRRWLAGGTLCYRREWWRAHPFANIGVGEDGAFVAAARGSRLMTLRDPTFYVALIHAGNTSPKNTGGSQWRPYATDDVRRILGPDWDSFAAGTPIHRRPAPVAHPRVTVSIPYYRTRDQIVRAVESILGQTYTNLRLVVVNDGDPEPPWDLLAHIDDPRLVRFDLPVNRGRYFADAVVVDATPDTLHLVQDSDDWSEPDRLAALLEAIQTSDAHAIVSAGFNHHEGALEKTRLWDHFPARGRPLTPDNDHRLNHVGLFSVPALRAIGGYYGGERIGYDTLIGNLLLMTGEVGYVDKPLYHRLIRRGSLTLSPDTGIGTPARQAVGRSLYEVYREVYGLYLAHREGTLSRDELTRRIRAIHDRRVSAADRSNLRDAARRLRALFADQDEQWAAHPDLFVPRSAAPTAEPRSKALIEDRRFRWNAWTVTRALAGALVDRLEAAKPKHILELGSGISTVILAEHAARTGASVVSLEHDSGYREHTTRLLTSFGLQDQVELRLAPLKPRPCPDGHTYPFYDTGLDGSFDFVLIDGPPLRHGRQAAFFALSGHLGRGWEVWLDDGRRDHEQHCLELWRNHFTFDAALYDFDQKGVWILRAANAGAGQERPAVRRLANPARAEIAAAVTLEPADAGDRRSATPLVSCMMPTFDRRGFVPQAISLFERQDYPNRELVIVDDGTDPVADLIPADPRYRYVRLERRASIGAKRNIACEAAKGEIVIGWDDDDWYAPSRITEQTAPIRAGRADAVGLTESLMLELATGRYWRCTQELQGRMFASGIVSGTLAFLRRLWLDGARFPDASLAEDASFQAAIVRLGARLERVDDGDLFIYVRHGTNSWRFTAGTFLDRRGWHNVPAPEFLAPEDVLAFRALRASVFSAGPAGQARGRRSTRASAAPLPSTS